MENSKVPFADLKLPFGKHRGKPVSEVPDDYLRWALNNNVLKGRAMLYAKHKLGYPTDKYEVRVKDSLDTDGTYLIDAYSERDAIWRCVKQHRIRYTQSYHGTEIDVTKL